MRKVVLLLLLTNLQNLFKFHQFFHSGPFSIQNPTRIPHGIYLSCHSSIFHDIDFFKGSYFTECLSMCIYVMLSHDEIDVMHFWQDYRTSGIEPFSVHHIQRYMGLRCLITRTLSLII